MILFTNGRAGALLCAGLFLSAVPATASAQAQLMGGAAVADITPPVGYPHYRGLATSVHDPLQAKALVFRQGDERAALVVADLTSIIPELAAEARTIASQKTGIPFGNIIVAATHSHTAVSYGGEMERYIARKRAGILTAADEASYPARLIRQVAQAVIDADAGARPVQLQAGAGEAHGIAFNRRFFLRNGTVRMNPGVRNPDVVREAGPIDPEVNILMLRPASGSQPFAGLTVFANHLDTVGDTAFSADYPHYLSQSLRKVLGNGFISVFALGTAGDINHIDVRATAGSPAQKGHGGTTSRIGETLGRVVAAAVPSLHVERPSLAMRSTYVYAPLQAYTAEELAWARDTTTAPLYAERERQQGFRRRKILSLERMRSSGAAIPPTVGTEPWRLPLEVQVIRVGEETAVVGLPGEVFVELGLAIKEGSPFANTMVIELTNNNIAYVPTREGFAQGDYEAVNSRVAPGGGEMMVQAALRLLRELKEAPSGGAR